MVDTVNAATVEELFSTVRYLLGLYSCGATQLAFWRHSSSIELSFHRLAKVARTLEETSHSRKPLALLARQSYWCLAFYHAYALVGVVPVATGRASMAEPRCVFHVGHFLFGHSWLVNLCLELAMAPLWWIAAVCSVLSCCTLYPIITTIGPATGEMHKAVGRSLEVDQCSSLQPSLQSELLAAFCVADKVLADVVFNLLPGLFGLPLLGTVQAVTRGKYDFYSLSTTPVIFIVLLPICFAGDWTRKERAGLSFQAYCGPWLEETTAQRRTRLGMMQSTLGRGCLIRVTGLFVMDRATFLHAIEGWYNHVRVISDLTG
ncbi:uncharacterized protein LOC117652686 [Thrips palmi]|uniref:Uncharacterized protein LOC117652686 n=1 Tax=Thrips palmi TaxID=161013 RepID=A0A6P9A6X0_THRPL|nr:uncharacterized protein LOC117652686 [Thrips palmi]